MANKQEGLGPVKRFGVRYGRTVKVRRAAVEVLQKNSTKCPYCNKHQVKRKAKGIWHCGKCDNTFTGQAYTFEKKSNVAALPPIEEVMAEQTEEEETEA